MQSANCSRLMTGLPVPTKAVYGYGVAAWKVTLTVRSSRASTDVTPEKSPLAVHPVASSVQYCHVKTTSCAVRLLPSDQARSSRSVHVMEVRSSATPPLSSVGMSAARAGTSTPSGSYFASGSSVMAPASRSLNPPERYGLSVEGACQ